MVLQDSPALLAAKKAARSRAKAALAALSPEDLQQAGAQIADRLFALPCWQAAKTVCCFVSMPNEADTMPILRAALTQGKRLCVPRMLGAGQMEMLPLQNLVLLRKNSYGILEPPADNSQPPLPAEAIDLLLLPCLAAAPNGLRLGRGGGYYDRFLASYAGCAGTVAILCPDALLLPSDELPAGPNDQPAGLVITQQQVFAAQ